MHRLLLLLLLLTGNANSQMINWQWAKTNSAGKHDDKSMFVACDKHKNVYICGYYKSDSIQFGSVVLQNIRPDLNSSQQNIYSDMFVNKYDSSGVLIWSKNFGGNYSDEATGLDIDSSGNIYVIGHFYSDTLQFGSSILINTNTPNNIVALKANLFVLKLDPNGIPIWAKSAIHGKRGSQTFGVKVDPMNRAIITGYFSDSSIIFGNDTLLQSSVNPSFNWYDPNIFLVCYQPSGNVVWAKSFGGHSGDEGHALTTDDTGNIYLTGIFRSPTIQFDSFQLTNTEVNLAEIFVAKLTSNGITLWAKSATCLNSAGEDSKAICLDNDKNIYITGYFKGPVMTLDTLVLTSPSQCNGTENVFLFKISNSGTALWGKTGMGTESDSGNDVCTDSKNNVFLLAGFGSDSIVFDSLVIHSSNTSNNVIVKYNSNGLLVNYERDSTSSLGASIGTSLCIDNADQICYTGCYNAQYNYFSGLVLTNVLVGTMNTFIARQLASNSTDLKNISSINNEVLLFPNPCKNYLHAVSEAFQNERNFTLSIFNLLGKKQPINYAIQSNQIRITTQDLPAGIYFLNIQHKQIAQTYSFLKVE